MLRNKSGETIVEVIASIFIFLIMLAILQGAVSYSRAMLQKNKEIRAQNAQILDSLSNAELNLNGSQTIRFMAVNSDMTESGNTVFSVPTNLGYKYADYVDSNGTASMRFYLYAPTTDSTESGTDTNAQPDDGGGSD